mmetsp:Transcript_11969/g.17886  ORF Transcript_11969/g.17886 Transcript_11969/m.17886 type:complete len:236 (-) Transcript_11969:24-731(-)
MFDVGFAARERVNFVVTSHGEARVDQDFPKVGDGRGDLLSPPLFPVIPRQTLRTACLTRVRAARRVDLHRTVRVHFEHVVELVVGGHELPVTHFAAVPRVIVEVQHVRVVLHRAVRQGRRDLAEGGDVHVGLLHFFVVRAFIGDTIFDETVVHLMRQRHLGDGDVNAGHSVIELIPSHHRLERHALVVVVAVQVERVGGSVHWLLLIIVGRAENLLDWLGVPFAFSIHGMVRVVG